MAHCEICGKRISSFGGSFNVDGKIACSKCELEIRKNRRALQPIIDDIKKRGAWDVLVKYVEKYYENPLQELEKLNYILNTKYGINIDGDIFINLIELAKLKELIQDRKKLIEIKKFEEEFLGGKDKKKQIE